MRRMFKEAAFMMMIFTVIMAFFAGVALCTTNMRAFYCTAVAGIVSGIAASLADRLSKERRNNVF